MQVRFVVGTRASWRESWSATPSWSAGRYDESLVEGDAVGEGDAVVALPGIDIWLLGAKDNPSGA